MEQTEKRGPGRPSQGRKKGAEASAEASDVREAPVGYRVAPGKAVTSKRGILTEEVSAGDLYDGEEGLKNLIEAGYIVKDEPA